tara:strand:+ start:8200 stop:9018 length:819 start_codon:yes stop_codon:yes gene_type:complete
LPSSNLNEIFTSVLFGLLQGILEWIPVSSQGIITLIYTKFYNKPFSESIEYAIWLHIGTSLSVLIYMRKDFLQIIKSIPYKSNKNSSPSLLGFFIISSLTSALIGIPLFYLITNINTTSSVFIMGLIGVFMMITGILQLRKISVNIRDLNKLNKFDYIIVGISQGLSIIPGLSRSGLTISTLLIRHIDKKESINLSLIMSLPATLGFALIIGLKEGFIFSPNYLISALVACITGIITIKAMLSLAKKINFSQFVFFIGLIIFTSSIIELTII